MVQVRCPGCGYIQSLSEERFLSISEDFLNCPHCNEKVPKTWTPVSGETMPEEVEHKIMAFSKRILNGGDISRDMVLALESHVRRYGAIPESNKALGIGYLLLGDYKRSEEFLVQSLTEKSDDVEVQRGLQDVFLALEKYDEALKISLMLIENRQGDISDDDIGGLALTYLALDRKDDAKKLFAKFPHVDDKNARIKKARKRLTKSKNMGLKSLLSEKTLHRFLKRITESTLRGYDHKASTVKDTRPHHEEPLDDNVQIVPHLQQHLEYWVYAPGNFTPDWQHIQEGFGNLYEKKTERDRALRTLDTLIEKNSLTIEYIAREQADYYFEYPEDLIAQNARGFESHDLDILKQSQIIVRLKLLLPQYNGMEHHILMSNLTEAVREITSGIVQDAVSHVLWGVADWKLVQADLRIHVIENNVKFESLDEGDTVWIHTHGMQKFGFPDLEIDGIPKKSAVLGKTLLYRIAVHLLNSGTNGTILGKPIFIPETKKSIVLELRPNESDDHFPAESLAVVSCQTLPNTVETIEQQQNYDSDDDLVDFSAETTDNAGAEREEAFNSEAQEHILSAHRKARENLPVFKRSFQQRNASPGGIHAVKVGFPAQGGKYEWMWVSLDAWRGQSLVGYLENSPILRKDLHRGSRVHFSEGEIFDWVISRSGSVVKGCFTE